MSKMIFTDSVRVATSFMVNLIHSNGEMKLDRGVEFSTPSLTWKYFDWFYTIKGTPIERGEETRSGPHNYTLLRRKVSFYGYKKTLLAEICLEGNEFVNSNKTRPTFWRVVKIKIRRYYDESSLHQEPNWYLTHFTPEETPVQ